MRKGFSLIELMLVLFISSMMVLGLYQMFSQVRRTVNRITSVIDRDLPLMALYAQLEKDVSGMFAPQFVLKPYIEKEMKKEQERTKKKEAEKKEAQQKVEKQEVAQKEESKSGPQDPVMFIDHKDSTLWWSFITTGGLQTIDREGKITVAPYVRRVAYILERDPQNPDIMHLMYRYQTDKTDLKTIQAVTFTPSFELMSHIKDFAVEFTVFEEESDEKKKEAAQPEAKKVSSTLKEWKEEEIWNKYKTLIPAYVRIRGTQGDPAGKGEYPFEFIFKVFAYERYRSKPKPALPESGEPFQKLEEWAKTRLPEVLGQNGKGT